MPSSRHARMTRIAISPRLAMRILLKSLLFNPLMMRACSSRDRKQWLAGRDHLAFPDVDLAHLARHSGDDVVLHLHRLQDRDHVAKPDVVAGLDRDLDDEPLHRSRD